MKNNFKIAFSGMIIGLSIISMFMAGIFPFAEYTFPAISGVLLMALVIHFGRKQSVIAYLAVSLLSLILTPNKEAAVLFVGFFGYYPILKSVFEQIKQVAISYVAKIVTFNVAVVISYFVLINLFSMTKLLEDFAFIEYGTAVFLALANIIFVIYDLSLTKIVSFYVNYVVPKYFSKFF